MDKKNNCLSFVGKDNNHLISAICDSKQMTVTIATEKGIVTYFLHRQDEICHHRPE